MAGLVKAKKYDWRDSNLALFGSDTEKNVSFQFQNGWRSRQATTLQLSSGEFSRVWQQLMDYTSLFQGPLSIM